MSQKIETEPKSQPKLEVLREFSIVERGKQASNHPQLAAISPDGYYMVYFEKPNSYVLNQNGKIICEVQSEFQSLQFSGDSQIIAVLFQHKKVFKIVIYNLKQQKILKELFFDNIRDLGKHSILFEGQLCFYFLETNLVYFDCQDNNQSILIHFNLSNRQYFGPYTLESIRKKIVLARITLDKNYQRQYLIYVYHKCYGKNKFIRISLVKQNRQILYLDNNLLLEGPKIQLSSAPNSKIVRKIEQKFVGPAKICLINYHLYYFYQFYFYKINLQTASITEHQFFIPPIFGQLKGDYTISINPLFVEKIEIRKNDNKIINNIIVYQFKD